MRYKDYAFVSEIIYRHADKEMGESNRGGERFTNPLSTESLALMEHLRGMGIPIMIHWEMYDWEKDARAFGEFFRRFPDQKFIIPHMGFGSPAQVSEILNRHDNVYMTISKRSVWLPAIKDRTKAAAAPPLSIVDESGKITEEWKNTFTLFSGRLLFATDTHKNYLWEDYPDIIRRYRLLLGQLPGEIAEKIAHSNAEQLYNIQTGADGLQPPRSK